jgi:hypothetical protein
VSFAKALERGDGVSACLLLMPSVVRSVEESDGRPCARAILSVGLPPAADATDIHVYGVNAQVVTSTDVLFLSQSADGWRIFAAGCRAQSGDQPYSCMMAAG